MAIKFSRLFFLLSICALPILGSAQIFGKQNLYSPKLQIGISTSGYSFFDGNPIFYNGLGDNYSYLVKNRGIEFVYFITQRNSIRFTYNKVQIDYLLDISSPKPLGTPFFRGFHLLNIEYTYKVLSTHFLDLGLSLGLSYRYGSEYYVIGYSGFEAFFETKYTNDLGISLGSNFLIPIVKGLNTNIGFKYTNFVYRKDTGGSIYYEDNGSSQHMFAISLGIGYAFSFKKKQKDFTD